MSAMGCSARDPVAVSAARSQLRRDERCQFDRVPVVVVGTALAPKPEVSPDQVDAFVPNQLCAPGSATEMEGKRTVKAPST